MKTNIFNVKEKREKKLILEEERIKNPFLLFLKRHKNFILMSIIMLLFCLMLISTGLAFSLFRGSNDYDISYIEGSETIDSNNNPEIDDEEIKEELLGEIAREEGIVLLVKTIMTGKGDVISYYTDGTAVVVQSDGKIYRISTNKQKQYGIDEKGKIDSTAKKILVTSNTNTLTDGTIITNYSDGSAKIEYKNQTYFVRDSNNIKLHNENSLDNLAPSGVAPTKENKRIRNNNAITFTNNTHLVNINGKKYIVNKNTNITVTESEIEYDTKNSYKAIGEKKYSDGNTITHFENGSAIITDSNGNVTYVKKSGDLLLRNKKLYEILPNQTGFSNSRTTIKATDGKRVTYFDNAAAIIINQDGSREYVEDNDDILYNNNKNISSTPITHKQIDKRVTEDGNIAYLFANGKTQVIRENGTSYVTETSKIEFKPKEEPPKEAPPKEEEQPSHGSPNENLGEGIYISEAKNIYNDFMNREDTIFIIKNNNKSSRTLRITIEEVNDYQKYNTSRLAPEYVKFQATVGDNYVPARSLYDPENKSYIWSNSEGITNYIIYEGTINAKETVEVALRLYVDYESIGNGEQNKGFIGTIKTYVDDSFLDNE